MIRLSSNQTLLLKLVIPVFFIVLYGLLTIFFLVSERSPLPDSGWMKYSNIIFYLAIILIFYKTVFQLQRVDCGPEYFVVTNYKTAYRYSYDSIASFKLEKLFLFNLGVLHFKSPSAFGKQVTILLDKNNLKKIREVYQVFN